jgi:L-lysine epsilon oxidase-like protein
MSDAAYEIHPALGIARLGNAPDRFYIGPERSGGLPLHADGSDRAFGPEDFRDGEGRLRRQAARFRVFRRAGGKVEEITLDSAGVRAIRWRAHLANKKASWYRFDTVKGQNGYGPNHPLRNASITGAEARRRLIIDPGPREIAGRSAARVDFSRTTIPPGYRGGNFPPADLKPDAIDTLGALETDAAGRLLVLGGLGHSGSRADEPKLGEYANNDGWWDDIADGPVSATIELADGSTIEAKAAWVAVAPPAYAPEIGNLVTLYDTMFDSAVRQCGARPDIYAQGLWNGGAQGYLPHFETEIKPILERGAGYVWVAPIPRAQHAFDYAKLGDPDPAGAGDRQFYVAILRGPGEENAADSHVPHVSMMPMLAGDDVVGAEDDAALPRTTAKYLSLTDTQFFFLQQWAAGHFKAGAAPGGDAAAQLTRAVLENCVGGALSPGIEVTWIARDPAIFAEAFRIRAKVPAPDPLSLGFDPESGLEPGDLTRYMALPWQADFNECGKQRIAGRVIWWWPAQRPTTVFLEGDGSGTSESPVPWIGTDEDPARRDYLAFADHMDMLRNWSRLGFVMNRGTPEAPRFVEVARTLPRAPSKPK